MFQQIQCIAQKKDVSTSFRITAAGKVNVLFFTEKSAIDKQANNLKQTKHANKRLPFAGKISNP